MIGIISTIRQVSPSGPVPYVFGALVTTWAASELILGRLGLDADSIYDDRGSALLVLLTSGVGSALALPAARARLLGISDRGRWAGLGLMAAGLGLRVFSIAWLGPMFTRFVQIVPGHTLVTTGPYRFVRHPSYSGLLLFYVGIGLALGDRLAVASMVVLPAVGIIYRIMVEEEALGAAFGDEYGRYSRRVKRLVPFVI